MNEKQRLSKILDIIKKNDRIGFNELFRRIEKTEDGLGRDTLGRALNHLIEDGKIEKIQIVGRQNVMYTDKIKLVKEEERKLRKFQRLLKENRKRLDDLREILYFLDPADAYFMFGRFVRLMWPYDLLFFEKRKPYYDIEFQQMFSDFDRLKKEFFELVNIAISTNKLTMKDFSESVFSYSDDAKDDFDADMESFQSESKY